MQPIVYEGVNMLLIILVYYALVLYELDLDKMLEFIISLDLDNMLTPDKMHLLEFLTTSTLTEIEHKMESLGVKYYEIIHSDQAEESDPEWT